LWRRRFDEQKMPRDAGVVNAWRPFELSSAAP
jgi:hypothetical protein